MVSDSTNVLALEAATWRRGQRSDGRCDLAACHRQLRAQVFGPGAAAHFRLFTLVSSARDTGSGRTEASMLIRHLAYWLTTWTAQLTSNAKERCLVSCLATERLTSLISG